MNTLPSIIVTSLGFAVFALLHTLLAQPWLKQKILDSWPAAKSYYRLFYSLFALFTLAIWYFLSPFPKGLLYDISYPWNLLFRSLQVLGAVGFFLSLKAINLNEFIGLNRLWEKHSVQHNRSDSQELVTRGIYKWVRHPLYSSTVIILMFHPSMSAKLALITVLIILYCWIGAIFEERNLIKKYGENYIRYKEEVPRFIPKIKLF